MITVAGQLVTLPDLRGKLKARLERFFALSEIQAIVGPISTRTNRPQSRSGYGSATGLPLFNYPSAPKPELYSLYWPTGATRWASLFVLVDGATLQEILLATSSGNASVPVVLQDTRNNLNVTTQMFCLAPRPLNTANAKTRLYVLPLVDERYYWQEKHSGFFTVADGDTWDEAFTFLSTQLGVTIVHNTVSADYQQPDIAEMTRRYENAALLLDAVAASVGQRIVRQTDGTVESLNWSTSATTHATNIATGQLLMGGTISGVHDKSLLPSSVLVTFPKWRQFYPDPNGDLYTVSNANTGGTTGAIKTIHSTAFADFSTKSSDPDNRTNLQTLATRISTDYYASKAIAHDIQYASLKSWTFTAFDDCMIWRFGSTVENHDPNENEQPFVYQASSRIQSLPYNFGEEEQLQQFTGLIVYPRLARFSLYGTLTPGSNCAAKFVSDTSTGTTVTANQLTLYDPEGRAFGLLGEQGWAEYKNDTLRWEFVSMTGCLTRHGTADSNTGAGVSGNVNIYVGASPSGVQVFAVNWSSTALTSGDKVDVFYEPASTTWYMIPPGKKGDPGTDDGAIVTVRGASATSDCMWIGALAVPNAGATAYCSDQFPDGDTIWLVVLNSDVGSTSADKVSLTVGEHYLARKVGSIAGVDVYAIRADGASTLTRFQLTADLVLGIDPVAPNAAILTWQAGDYSIIGNDSITVFDITVSAGVNLQQNRGNWEGKPTTGYQTGHRGWCTKKADSNRYEIVWMEHTAKAIEFSLGANGILGFATEHFDGKSPDPNSQGIDILDDAHLFRHRGSDAAGIALRADGNADQPTSYQMIQCETFAGVAIIRTTDDFTTKTTDTNGLIFQWWGSQQDVLDPTGDGEPINIRNQFGVWSHALSGAEGFGTFDSVENVYRPVLLNQKAIICTAVLTTVLNSTDSVAQFAGGLNPCTFFPLGMRDAKVKTAANLFGAKGALGSTIVLIWDENRGQYLVLPVSSPMLLTAGTCANALGALPGGIFPAILEDGSEVNDVTNIGYSKVMYANQVIIWRDPANQQYFGFKPDSPDVQFLCNSQASAFGVLAILGVGISNAGDRCFVTDTPSTTFSRNYLCNTGFSFEPDVIGNGFGTRFVQAKPYSGTPQLGETWGPAPGTQFLKKGYPGFTSIGPAELGIVVLPSLPVFEFIQEPINQLLCKATSNISNAASSTAYKIFVGTKGSEVDGGWTTVPSLYNRSGQQINSGDFFTALWINDGWEVDCTATRKARFISGTLSGTLTAGGSVTCAVSVYRDGPNPGSSLTVFSDESIFTGTSGKAYKAYYSPEDDKYYFIWVGC